MGIPKPLVKTNQLFITITTIASLLWDDALLLLPIIVGVITLITKKNPIILMGRRFLRKPLHQYIQEDKEQQLFNQWIATILLSGSFIFFLLGFDKVGYVLSFMVIAASGIAFCGYCIGCTIRYRYMMWKYKQNQKRAA
jgi:uncharacterized membrane protein